MTEVLHVVVHEATKPDDSLVVGGAYRITASIDGCDVGPSTAQRDFLDGEAYFGENLSVGFLPSNNRLVVRLQKCRNGVVTTVAAAALTLNEVTSNPAASWHMRLCARRNVRCILRVTIRKYTKISQDASERIELPAIRPQGCGPIGLVAVGARVITCPLVKVLAEHSLDMFFIPWTILKGIRHLHMHLQWERQKRQQDHDDGFHAIDATPTNQDA